MIFLIFLFEAMRQVTASRAHAIYHQVLVALFQIFEIRLVTAMCLITLSFAYQSESVDFESNMLIAQVLANKTLADSDW